MTFTFSEGSVGTLLYTCAGAPGMSKERIEVFGGKRGAVINNFETAELGSSNGRWKRHRVLGKGYHEQLAAFAQAVKGIAPLTVTAFDGLRATACALAALKALKEGVPQSVSTEADNARRQTTDRP